MWGYLRLVAAFVPLSVAGCGTFVPPLKEYPANYADSQNNSMVLGIISSIKCELREAVTKAIDLEIRRAKSLGGPPYSNYLNNWGVESLLVLTIRESTTISPSTILMPPSIPASILNIAGGFGVEQSATRIEKINTFYTLKELYMRRGDPPCERSGPAVTGSYLIRSDLRIVDLLAIKMSSVGFGLANPPEAGEKNVLSHQITFQTVYSGDLTPSWRLVRATINPNRLLSTNRDQTHELQLTFGPISRAAGGRSLTALAEQTHIASQITSGLLNAGRLRQ